MTSSPTSPAARGPQPPRAAFPQPLGLNAGAVLAKRCRAFRVDGPDGRIGVVKRAVDNRNGSGFLEVSTGLFITRIVRIPFTEVVGINLRQHRLTVRARPERIRPGRKVLARCVRRFLRSAGSQPD